MFYNESNTVHMLIRLKTRLTFFYEPILITDICTGFDLQYLPSVFSEVKFSF